MFKFLCWLWADSAFCTLIIQKKFFCSLNLEHRNAFRGLAKCLCAFFFFFFVFHVFFTIQLQQTKALNQILKKKNVKNSKNKNKWIPKVASSKQTKYNVSQSDFKWNMFLFHFKRWFFLSLYVCDFHSFTLVQVMFFLIWFRHTVKVGNYFFLYYAEHKLKFCVVSSAILSWILRFRREERKWIFTWYGVRAPHRHNSIEHDIFSETLFQTKNSGKK